MGNAYWDQQVEALPPMARLLALLDLDPHVRVWTTSGAFFCGVVTDTPDPALLRIATSSAKDKWTIADNYTITTIDSRAVVAYIA